MFWPGCVLHASGVFVLSFPLLSSTLPTFWGIWIQLYWRGQTERGGAEAAQFGVSSSFFSMFYSQSFSPSMYGIVGFCYFSLGWRFWVDQLLSFVWFSWITFEFVVSGGNTEYSGKLQAGSAASPSFVLFGRDFLPIEIVSVKLELREWRHGGNE